MTILIFSTGSSPSSKVRGNVRAPPAVRGVYSRSAGDVNEKDNESPIEAMRCLRCDS